MRRDVKRFEGPGEWWERGCGFRFVHGSVVAQLRRG